MPEIDEPSRALLTVAEASKRLGICVHTLRAHMNAGELKFINIGRGTRRKCVRFEPSDLQDFVDSKRQTASSTLGPGATSRIGGPRGKRRPIAADLPELIGFTARMRLEAARRRN